MGHICNNGVERINVNMTEPCDKAKEIECLQSHAYQVNGNLVEMEKRQIVIADKVNNIKDNLDLIISVKIIEISQTLKNVELTVTKYVSIIEHTKRFTDRIEDVSWWMIKILIIVIVGIIIWAISHGAHVGVGIGT